MANARISPRGWQGRVVLVADDDAAVRALVARILARSGMTVLQAADGRAALSMACERGGAMDLVVTDLEMPYLGGIELAEELRARFPGLQVMAMSGMASPNWGGKLLRKPFRAEALIDGVAEALGE